MIINPLTIMMITFISLLLLFLLYLRYQQVFLIRNPVTIFGKQKMLIEKSIDELTFSVINIEEFPGLHLSNCTQIPRDASFLVSCLKF